MIFRVGDQARLITVPPEQAFHVDKLVTIILHGAFVFDDEVLVETEDGARLLVCEEQLARPVLH
jgi:hypothetical protein